MVPGLSAEISLRCGLDDSAVQTARLVSSFPTTLATQQASLITGAPPSEHGVLFPEDTSRLPALIEPWHEVEDSLLRGGSAEELRARILERADACDVLLVSGCPIGEPVRRIIEPAPRQPEGFQLRIDDSFALCEPGTDRDSLPAALLDEWLGTPGIERVLAPTPESAGAWMAPAERGWVLVAERGWAFRDTDLAFGRHDCGNAVLLAFGSPWPQQWPTSVHDWRVAPTLLELVGRDGSGCFDAALDGARGLGS
jgi:hypothetical protein